jgi:hypothetical protein
VSDVDNATLASAAVSISSGFLAGDVLAFTNTSSSTYGNIAASYSAGTGLLTLTSAGATATTAQWQAALDAVQYSSTSANPTNFGADNSRTISWVANDGVVNSATETTIVSILPTSTAYVWGTDNFLGQAVSGTHIYSPFVAVNQSNKGIVGVLYGVTSSNYNPNGPDNVSLVLNLLNPFFLSMNQGGLVIDSTVQQFPSPYTLSIPDTSSHDGEGIAIYQTEDSSGNRFLNEAFVTGNGGILNIGGVTQIAGPLLYPTENPLFIQFRETSSALTSYAVAFDQYDQASGTYTINLETFVHNSSDPNYDSSSDFTASGVVPAVTFTGLTGGRTTLPASFYNSLTSTSGGGLYALAYAENNAPHVGQDYIEFLSYTASGALNTSFGPGNQGYVEIAPDLSAYGSDPSLIHNQITLEADNGTHTGNPTPLSFIQPNGSGPLFVAWNETVTVDGNPNTYDQVEFVRHASFLAQVDQYFTFQIPDGQAQNVKLQSHSYYNGLGNGALGNGTMVELAYGDSASTTIVDFFYNTTTGTTTQIGTYTEATPNGQTYNSIRDLGDGRVAIIYDDQINSGAGTTQVTTNIVDFRTTGVNINDSGQTGGQQYVAGTHFNDTFIGENNNSNEYYFIGQNSAVGPAPTDTFTGGQYGSNIAIFPDAISNYTISSVQADGSVTVTNTGDPLHAGSLKLTGIQWSPGVNVPSVQALAFGPSKDPQQNGGGGALEASAGTLYITGPLYNPVFIDSGAVLEFGAPNNNTNGSAVSSTFLDTGGTLKLDAPAQNTLANPINFTGDIVLSARTNGPTSTDIIDLANISVSSASLAGTILTVNLTGGAVTYQVFGGTPGAIATSSDGAGGTDLFLMPVGSLWGESTFPLQPTTGSHLYGPSGIQFNSGIGAVGFGITPANYVNSGPDIVLDSILRIDPFLLPYATGVQAIPASETTVSSFPDKFNLIEPVLNSTGQVEQILIYETQDSSGNPALNQIAINEGTGGPNSLWTVGTPTQIVPTLIGLQIENLSSSFTTSSNVLSNYSVAWDQFDPVGHTENVYFEIFNPNGSLATGSPVSLSSVSGVASPGSLPAWLFRSAGGASAYASAVATNIASGVNTIQVQGYNSNGTTNGFNFTIQPNLSAYAPGATNQILDEAGGSNVHGVPTSALQFALNPTSGSGFSFAWNETVTDSNGTHDQVEFALVTSVSGVWTVTSRSTFQVSDGELQNVRVGTYNYLGNNFEVLAYGDDTGTHVVEFDHLGNPVAVVTDTTPQLFSQLTIFGDGRIGIVYNDTLDALGTSQLETHVYDLRTAGIPNTYTGIANGQNIDFAGTQFNDAVQGLNNVDNTYYYVGSHTAGTPPSDVFHGGTGASSWNTVIFADGRADYTVTTGASTIITNIDPQHAHAGTLTVDHVQALVFNPTVDPVPQSNGSLEASGDTLLLSPFASTVTLDSNATLELSQPSSFTGHISGFSPVNHIDLDGFNPSTTNISFNGTSDGGTLTVTDSTHTVGLGNAATIALNGSYNTATFTPTTDGHGGVDIGMTNTDHAVADNIIASTSLLQSGSVTIPASLLLANDTDSNGATLSVLSVDASDPPQQTLGGVLLNGNGNIAYTAPAGVSSLGAGQQASDSFDYTLMDSNGAQSTGHVNLTLIGGTQITGTMGNDIFVSSPANETFTGVGGNDTFVFTPGFGQDTITDFHPGDTIQIDHTIFADFNSLISHAQTVGANTVITDAASNSITLAHIALANLHANDFHFV